MKQSADYKKQLHKFAKAAFLGVFLLVAFYVQAQTLDELQQKIDQNSSEISKIEQEIKAYQKELSSIGAQKDTLANQLKQLDINRKKLAADINLTQKKIEKTNFQISNLNVDIGKKEKSILNNKEAVAISLRSINELDSDGVLVSTIINHTDFTSIWNDIDNMTSVREKIINQIGKLKLVKNELVGSRDAATIARNELSELKNELADQKKIVEQNTKEKNDLLKKTKNNEANYQKLVKDQIAKKNALEADIRNYESKIKFILDPKSLPGPGVLSWPVDDVYITQLFGKTVDAKRLYASGSHSGVDFRASVGTPIKSVADGVVSGVGDTDQTCPGASFGKWVFIEHNNGLASTYGHLSLSKVSVGDRVSRGQIIAYSGATGHVTGPHLHLTIYAPHAAEVKTFPSKSCSGKTLTQPLAATNAYLDPMLYLPPYKN